MNSKILEENNIPYSWAIGEIPKGMDKFRYRLRYKDSECWYEDIYCYSRKDLIELINYWNSKNKDWKYWV